DAKTMYERALHIRRRALGQEHPLVAWTLVNLAGILAPRGRTEEALRNVDEALAIYMKAGEGDEPDHLARALEAKGRLLATRGRLFEARASLVRALSERIRVF